MPFAIAAKLDGLDDVLKRARRLRDGSTRRAILRRAVDKGTQGITRTAKDLAPVDDGQTGAPGLYKKSIGRRVKTYGDFVIGLIGPRTGFRTVVRTRKRDGQPVYQDPARIGHLVEFGHGGPSPAPPRPHLRPAWDTGKAAATATIATEIEAGLAKAVGR